MKQLGWGWVFGFLLFSFFLPWSSIRAVFPLEKKKNQHMNLSIKPISNEFTAAPCMLDAPGQNRFLRKDKTKIGSSGPDWELSVFLLSKVLPLWSRTQGGHREIWHNRGISYNDSVTARCFLSKKGSIPALQRAPLGAPLQSRQVFGALWKKQTNKQTDGFCSVIRVSWRGYSGNGVVQLRKCGKCHGTRSQRQSRCTTDAQRFWEVLERSDLFISVYPRLCERRGSSLHKASISVCWKDGRGNCLFEEQTKTYSIPNPYTYWAERGQANQEWAMNYFMLRGFPGRWGSCSLMWQEQRGSVVPFRETSLNLLAKKSALWRLPVTQSLKCVVPKPQGLNIILIFEM